MLVLESFARPCVEIGEVVEPPEPVRAADESTAEHGIAPVERPGQCRPEVSDLTVQDGVPMF